MGLPEGDINRMLEMQRLELARDPWSGIQRSMDKYYASATDYATQFGTIWTSTMDGMTDALTNFVTSGKLDFNDLANDFIKQVIRMQMQALVSGLFKGVTSFVGGLFGAGADAGGGAFGGDFGTRGFWSGHTGAIIGDSSAATRSVSPLAFVGAERYHSGGMLGLRPDEVPFVGLRGERVLNPAETRAYNAGQWAAGKSMTSATTPPVINLEVIIHSEGGGQVQETRQRQTSFDGQKMVAELWIAAFQNNTSGMRNVIAQGA